jgi:hypothetical protein
MIDGKVLFDRMQDTVRSWNNVVKERKISLYFILLYFFFLGKMFCQITLNFQKSILMQGNMH